MEEFEWGVQVTGEDEPYQTGMTREEAEQRLEDLEKYRGYSGTIYLIKRPVGPWRAADAPEPLKRPKPRPGITVASPRKMGW